jgi:hypothetical protein
MIVRLLWQAFMTLIEHTNRHGHLDRQGVNPFHCVLALLIPVKAMLHGCSWIVREYGISAAASTPATSDLLIKKGGRAD